MKWDAEQTIVVTGASSGIGREIAIQLSEPGRKLWLLGRDAQRLESVASEVRSKGATAEIVRIDLSDLDGVDAMLEQRFPASVKVDAIYLVAAITAFGEVQDMLGEDWDKIYRTNLLSPLQMGRHFYANMVGRKRGDIVLISSLAAYAGYPTATAYATMKAGLLGLYRSLWYEGKTHGVSVFHASLGYVGTEIYKSAIYRGTTYEKTMAAIRKLGFAILPASDAAARIIANVRRGKSEFSIPAYAAVMRWIAPRMPFVVSAVHRRIMNIYREPS